jgi:hypothetical protein
VGKDQNIFTLLLKPNLFSLFKVKTYRWAGYQWFSFVILATWEAEIRRIEV